MLRVKSFKVGVNPRGLTLHINDNEDINNLVNDAYFIYTHAHFGVMQGPFEFCGVPKIYK